ncbi:unnamed protein product [Blepharisma stoltei]|uniref:Uncharacterized protein n=1 Tax=Blepharisma stoltei TaxID=1481888 RepID=A0AAU9JWW2_9CILI|nr:unnamed protein product [Blepharisma stoltei]
MSKEADKPPKDAPIFSFTEIDRDKISQKFPNLRNRSSSMQDLYEKITTLRSSNSNRSSNSSWNNFIKRNLMPSMTPTSPKIIDLMEKAKKIDFSSPTSSLKSLTRLNSPSSSFLKEATQTIENSIMQLKASYNKIHHDVAQKERTLEILERDLELLENNLEIVDGGDKLEKLNDDYADISNKTIEETLYTETLQHMVINKRLEILGLRKPINMLKKQLKEASALYNHHSASLKRFRSEIPSTAEEFETAKYNFDMVKRNNSLKFNENTSHYEESHALIAYLKEIRRRKKVLESQREKEKKVILLERRLRILESEKKFEDEMENIKRELRKKEKIFMDIQKATNVTSVEDMYPYYLYLKETENRLNQTVKQGLKQLEKLNQDREELSKTLNGIRYQEEKRENLVDISVIRDKYSETCTELDQKEAHLDKLNEIIFAAQNSLEILKSKLGLKLSHSKDFIEQFQSCGDKLHELLKKSTDKKSKSPIYLDLRSVWVLM